MTTSTIPQRTRDAALLRRIWRVHFWVGLFGAPVLIVLALSGLVILYTEPIDTTLNRQLLVVDAGNDPIPLDAQIAVAGEHVDPGYEFDGVIPPKDAGRSTQVDFVDPAAPAYPNGESDLTQAFVNPYTGEYLGQRDQSSGLVGLANQLHRLFGNDGPTVALPSVGHLINPADFPDATIPVGLFNLWLEVTAVWILVLLGTGVYLWWPRAIEAAKPMFGVRWGKGGRTRWRDVHALTGVVLAVALIGYILSGLTWTRYWGENWRAFTSTVTHGVSVDAASTPATMGDYDRLGRRIAWAAADDPVYASEPAGPVPAALSFDDIDRIAKDEQMVPGYAIFGPVNSTADGITTWGSYAVVNHWPQRLSEQRTLYLNQFTGETIANATAAQDGALARVTSFGIDMHMGHQLGWVSRVIATLTCLGVLVSVVTGLTMWFFRRRYGGGTGLPARTDTGTRAATSQRAKVVAGLLAVGLSVLFPVFGASLLLVLAVEWALARRRADDGAADDDEVDDDADEVPVGASP